MESTSPTTAPRLRSGGHIASPSDAKLGPTKNRERFHLAATTTTGKIVGEGEGGRERKGGGLA